MVTRNSHKLDFGHRRCLKNLPSTKSECSDYTSQVLVEIHHYRSTHKWITQPSYPVLFPSGRGPFQLSFAAGSRTPAARNYHAVFRASTPVAEVEHGVR